MIIDMNEYDFDLPNELIAQTPLKNRSESKLMVLDKENGSIKHDTFKSIVKYLKKGDLLILNDTKVVPFRIFGIKDDTGAKIELLLLKEIEKDSYEALVRPQKRVKIGTVINVMDKLKLECIKILKDGICHFKIFYEGILYEILDEIGTMPLPPYIKEKLNDKNRYQTIYAKYKGSSAAPTAGLHFTNEIIDSLKEKGIIIKYVTLHVGLGTFRPIQKRYIDQDEKLHEEECFITDDVIDEIRKAKIEKRRVVAVGTTSLRLLESYANLDLKTNNFKTNIFIKEGYCFKVVDALITNFHLPKSSLLILVSSFYNKEKIKDAYKEAIEKNYRFFSFGDSMIIY